MKLLVDEGLIRRRQGLGSFVAPPPLRRQPSYLTSFTEAVLAQGRASTQRLLDFRETPWSEDLPYESSENLWRLDRLRLVDGVPTALHVSFLSDAVVRRIGLTAKGAENPKFSLYGAFAAAGLVVARGVETLRARIAQGREREMLDLSEDPVVMEVSRSTYDEAGALIDFVHAVYDARRYAYQAEIRIGGTARTQGSTPEEEEANGWKTRGESNFGARLGPWGDLDGDGGGKAGGAHHRPGRPRRSIL